MLNPIPLPFLTDKVPTSLPLTNSSSFTYVIYNSASLSAAVNAPSFKYD